VIQYQRLSKSLSTCAEAAGAGSTLSGGSPIGSTWKKKPNGGKENERNFNETVT
jgi:hypothetical protein